MLKEKSIAEKKSRKVWAKEMKLLVNKRNAYLKKYQIKKEFSPALTKRIPDKLSAALNAAFVKAFEIIYDKGAVIIDRTYTKEKAKQKYEINRFTAEVKQDRRSLKAFAKQSNAAGNLNLLVSGAEGIGLGLLGCGLPDIPLLTGVILRSLYEMSVNYGYDYSRPEEQMYQLLIIQGAMSYGEDLQQCMAKLDQYIAEQKQIPTEEMIQNQIRTAASALAEEMLFLKFVQGIPVVGVIGGLSDSIFVNRIQHFAKLNYQYRMLYELRSVYVE